MSRSDSGCHHVPLYGRFVASRPAALSSCRSRVSGHGLVRHVGILVMCIGLLLVAACSVPRKYRPSVPLAPIVSAQCPRSASELELYGSSVRYLTGAIPSDFVPVEVIHCRAENPRPVNDTESAWTVVQLAGPVTEHLTDALALPDLVDSDVDCPLQEAVHPFVLLVDAKQEAVRPRLPLDECGEV